MRRGGIAEESREGHIRKFHNICMNAAVEHIISHVSNNTKVES